MPHHLTAVPAAAPDATFSPAADVCAALRAIALISEAWLKGCAVSGDEYRSAIRIHGAVEYALSVAVEENDLQRQQVAGTTVSTSGQPG